MNNFPNPGSPDFPMALQAIRKKRQYTQVSLAKAINIHSDSIYRYENIDRKDFAIPSNLTWLKLKKELCIKESVAVDCKALTGALFGVTKINHRVVHDSNVQTCWQPVNTWPHKDIGIKNNIIVK